MLGKRTAKLLSLFSNEDDFLIISDVYKHFEYLSAKQFIQFIYECRRLEYLEINRLFDFDKDRYTYKYLQGQKMEHSVTDIKISTKGRDALAQHSFEIKTLHEMPSKSNRSNFIINIITIVIAIIALAVSIFK